MAKKFFGVYVYRESLARLWSWKMVKMSQGGTLSHAMALSLRQWPFQMPCPLLLLMSRFLLVSHRTNQYGQLACKDIRVLVFAVDQVK